MSPWRGTKPLVLSTLLALCCAAWTANAQTNRGHNLEATRGPALSDFKIIAERNIFNPKRYARSNSSRRETQRPTPNSSETLVLTGTLAYEKGWFAFFEGSRPSHKKVVQMGEEIAGLKVLRVEAQSVLMAEDTNHFKLKVGHQVKRQEEGRWRPAGEAELVSSSPPQIARPPVQPAPQAPAEEPQTPPDFIRQIIDTALGGGPPPPPLGGLPPQPPLQTPGAQVGAVTNDVPAQAITAPAASQDEILRRLMERREQEMNQ